MFSVGYRNNAMVISSQNQRRINCQNIEKLHEAVTKSLQNSNNKIILDFNGVKFIDSASFATINQLIELANRKDTDLAFSNIDKEVLELFDLIPEAVNYKIEELPKMASVYEKETVFS